MKFMRNLVRMENNKKYLFLFLIFIFALMSSIFYKKQTLENFNKEMHWGFPGSKPPAIMMRNF
jgi:hypothetical protein